MGEKFYEDVGGGAMKQWTDPQDLVQTELAAREVVFEEIEALSDDARTLIAAGGLGTGHANLNAFDLFIGDVLERVRDQQDYFAYVKANRTFDTFDHQWISPEAVESFNPDELLGNVATNAIDGDTGTFWRSTTAGAQITCRIRDTHRKRIDRIRLFHGAAGPTREQLSTINIRMAVNLAKIDDAENLIATVSPTWVGGVFVEITLPSPKNAKYIKLDGYSSAHASQSQIRELEVRAVVRGF